MVGTPPRRTRACALGTNRDGTTFFHLDGWQTQAHPSVLIFTAFHGFVTYTRQTLCQRLCATLSRKRQRHIRAASEQSAHRVFTFWQVGNGLSHRRVESISLPLVPIRVRSLSIECFARVRAEVFGGPFVQAIVAIRILDESEVGLARCFVAKGTNSTQTENVLAERDARHRHGIAETRFVKQISVRHFIQCFPFARFLVLVLKDETFCVVAIVVRQSETDGVAAEFIADVRSLDAWLPPRWHFLVVRIVGKGRFRVAIHLSCWCHPSIVVNESTRRSVPLVIAVTLHERTAFQHVHDFQDGSAVLLQLLTIVGRPALLGP